MAIRDALATINSAQRGTAEKVTCVPDRGVLERETAMRLTLLSAAFAVAINSATLADDQAAQAVEMAANNLSHEMTDCFAFHTIMAACLLKSNFKKESEQARKGAGIYLDFAAWLGERAKISKLDEVIKARSNMAQRDLFKLIDRDCRNISIAMDKYGDRCKGDCRGPCCGSI
jgi:hypothetical protein